MKFIEIAIPKNKDLDLPNRPEKVILNLGELVEASVIPLAPEDRTDIEATHALRLIFSTQEIAFQGTKTECEECYQALHTILNSDPPAKGSKFVVSAFP